jgi:hypothetical protein
LGYRVTLRAENDDERHANHRQKERKRRHGNIPNGFFVSA